MLVALCIATVIALVLTSMGTASRDLPRLQAFGVNWVYSLCIGICIQVLIETGRRAASSWLRLRDPGNPNYHEHWPGWSWMAGILPISVGLGYFGGALLADTLTGYRHVEQMLAGRERHTFTLVVAVLASLAATFYWYSYGKLRHAQALAEAARRTAAENQLKLLESQLEPHMLFNTLANLRVLIALDPPQAQRMLDRLITFLRSTLGASRVREHTLATEFERIDDYLALMQVRMGSRLSVHLDLPPELRELAVPSLLLQPVVENAIKHGLEPKVEGGRLVVAASVNGGQLCIRVTDTGLGPHHKLPEADGTRSAPSTGYGTGLVQQRLATLYGSEARADLAPGPDGVGAQVTIHLPRRPLGADSSLAA